MNGWRLLKEDEQKLYDEQIRKNADKSNASPFNRPGDGKTIVREVDLESMLGHKQPQKGLIEP